MNKLKTIFVSTLTLLLPTALMAQNGSNSSYSRFGLGTLAEQSQTFNRGMGGVAYGLRNGSRINMQNPASYSCIDSLSFIFDVGMSLQVGQISTQSKSVKTRNTTLNNINAGFRLGKNLGMSIGFMPFTTIGYTFSQQSQVGQAGNTGQTISSHTAYTGNGGLNLLYIGAGWKPFADFSIGANLSYLWGDYNHQVSQSFLEDGTTSTSYSGQNQLYSAELRTYKLDLGIQYPIRLNAQNWLIVGATYSLGHTIGGEASLLRYTSAGDSTEIKTDKAFDLPHSFGGGLAWQHKNRLTLAADYTYQQWGECKMPIAGKDDNGNVTYLSQKGEYMNRSRIALGAEFVPDAESRGYLSRVRYRAGINFSTPYLKVNGQDGPSEYHATLGLGLPLQTRRMAGRSVINVSAEWMMRKASTPTLAKENYFLLNVGISFNEKWFMKWKIN